MRPVPRKNVNQQRIELIRVPHQKDDQKNEASAQFHMELSVERWRKPWKDDMRQYAVQCRVTKMKH